MFDFFLLAAQCATDISPRLLANIVQVESAHNPYAIGVVGGYLQRQPRNQQEAVVTAQALAQAGWNFSMGLGQVNRYNLSRFGLDYQTVFEPCTNLRAAARIFNECHQRAGLQFAEPQTTWAALSCYYSGNFRRGFVKEGQQQRSYVGRVMEIAPQEMKIEPIPVIAMDAKKRGHLQIRQNSAAKQANSTTGKLKRLRGGERTDINQLRG